MDHSDHPAAQPGDQEETSTLQGQQADAVHALDQAIAGMARQAGATVHGYPRPGRADRRVVLREDTDDRGTRYEDAALEDDGVVRISGHDQGRRVSDFWGSAITSCEWVYVVAADRVPALIRLLGGHDGDDVLALLSSHYQHIGGRIDDLMKHPDLAAHFDNWHS